MLLLLFFCVYMYDIIFWVKMSQYPLCICFCSFWFMSDCVESYVWCRWLGGVVIRASDLWWIGTTVFCGMQIFEPSHGICKFPRNFYIFAEFSTGQWLERKYAIFFCSVSGSQRYVNICKHDCAVKYVTATQALTGYWAKFIWNIASLFGRQTVSVSCSKYYIFGRVQGL